MRVSLTLLLDLLGLMLLVAGVFLFDWRLGMAALGIILLAVSFVLDRSDRVT